MRGPPAAKGSLRVPLLGLPPDSGYLAGLQNRFSPTLRIIAVSLMNLALLTPIPCVVKISGNLHRLW